jgi:hypothetical protein
MRGPLLFPLRVLCAQRILYPMNTTDTPVSVSQLTAFVAACQEIVTTHYTKSYPNLTPSKLTFDFKGGMRYAKIIVTTDGGAGQRSVFGFVDMRSGDLLKAASWKGPTKNFARGNVHTTGATKGVSAYGIG